LTRWLHSAGAWRQAAACSAAAALAWCGVAGAADKSGVRTEAVQLPDGPGSVAGYGPGYAPDLPTGGMGFDFEYAFPKGPGGMAPSFSIGYDSGEGNGVMGFGWGITMPRIERKTVRPWPRYVDGPNGIDDDFDGITDEPDERDKIRVFAAGGPENLVDSDRLSDDDNLVLPPGDFFFARYEGAFIRYERVDDYWVATRPDGTRMEFGRTMAARQTDPDDDSRVFAWMLETETDVNGNTMTYEYEKFDDEDNRGTLYLRYIRYGAGAPPWNDYHIVALNYEERPDVFEDGKPGFITRVGRRLINVEVATHTDFLAGREELDYDGDGETDFLVRRYIYQYQTHPYWSLLSSSEEMGADGIDVLLPVTFTWRVADPPQVIEAENVEVFSVNTPRYLFDNPAVDLAELNGDGLTDLLQTNPAGGPHRAFLNLGEKEVEGKRVIEWSAPVDVGGDARAWAVNLASESPAADLADMNGDGFADLTYRADQFQAYYFPQEYENGLPKWGGRVKYNLFEGESTPPSPFGDDNVTRTDMNGDALGEVVQTISTGGYTTLRIWYNLGDGRFSRPQSVPQNFAYQLSDQGVSLEDFNGDDIDDFIRIRPTQIEVAPGLGYGRFAPIRIVEIEDFTFNDPWLVEPYFEDVTGDGLPEMIYDAGAFFYWINRGDYTIEPYREVQGLPAEIGFSPANRWADMNGNGSTDLVFVDVAGAETMTSVDVGEIIGCVPVPNLLIHIDNGQGGSTDITYASATRFALEAREAGQPWTDPVPLVTEVVTNVDNFDSFGNAYNETFAYYDAFWDSELQTFAGFGRVVYNDLGEPTAPTAVKRHRFDVGREDRVLRGLELELTIEDTEGNVYSRETTDWESRLLAIGDTGEEIKAAFAIRKTTELLEGGNGEPRKLVVETDYDNFGNEIQERNFGVVEDGNPGAFNDERIETTTYAYNTDAWIMRAPATVTMTDLAGNLIKRTETYYDDETFAGDNLGETTLGRKTLVRRWLDPASSAETIDSSRVQYDDFGNPIVMLDPLGVAPGGAVDFSAGHVREIVYDAAFQTFPEQEIIHVGGGKEPLTMSAVYDEGYSVVIESTDFSGNSTTYTWDMYATPELTYLPGDDEDFPSIMYGYGLGEEAAGGITNWVEIARLDKPPNTEGLEFEDHYRYTREYMNGLGVVVMNKEEAAPDPETGEPRVAVKDTIIFNGRGKPRYVLNPFFTTIGDDLFTQLELEDVRTEDWTGLFHVDGALAELTLDDAHKGETIYDVMLRPSRVTDAEGKLRLTEYEPLITRTFDENDTDPESPHFGTPTTMYRDGLDRLIQVDQTARLNDDGTPSDAVSTFTTRYEYRADDVRTRLIDHQQNVRSWTYDSIGRRLAFNDPNRGQSTYTYDAASNLIEAIDASGRRTTFTHDGVNRMLTEDYHDETESFSAGHVYDPALPLSEDNRPDVAYFYDTPSEDVDFGDGTSGSAEYTSARQSAVWDLAGEHYSSYDERGRLAWTVRSMPDPRSGLPVAFRTAMTYDTMDRLTEVVYPDGDRVAYGYDGRNSVNAISGGSLSNLDGTEGIVTAAVYAPSGQRERFEYGNGVATTYAYDAKKRLTALQSGGADGAELIRNRYTYDAMSNILGIADERSVEAVPDDDARRNHQQFAYDDLYRLASTDYAFDAAAGGFGEDGRIAHRYDAIGNMLEQSSDIEDTRGRFSVTNLGVMNYGGALGASGREGRNAGDPAGPQALTFLDDGAFTRDLTYDNQGNMLQLDGLAFTWNYANRMVASEDESARSEYVYDYAGQRMLKRVYPKDADGVVAAEPAEATQYIAKYFELREGGQPVKYVYDGDTRLARAVGTLDPAAPRTQRFRFAPGWNLAAVGVEADDAVTQLGFGPDARVTALVRWNAETGEYEPLEATDTLAAGDVFWLYAEEALHTQITGMLPAPADFEARTGFQALAAFQTLRADRVIPADAPIGWLHDADAQAWQARLSGDEAFLSTWPEFIQPGQPVYFAFDDAPDFGLPDASLDIQYYLQDHLGSSSVLADAAGRVIEETAYYPFGEPRHTWKAEFAEDTVPNHYGYSQKERDDETGLHYFDMRYLSGPLARFTRVDPAIDDLPEEALEDPQHLHAYAFARNNPINYTDPDGQFALNKAQSVLARQLNPFSDQASGNLTDNKAQRRAAVFGALKIDKGGKLDFGKGLPGGASIPEFAQPAIKKMQGQASLSPNELISGVEQVAKDLKAKFPGDKLNVDSFLKAITQDPDQSVDGKNARLKAFAAFGAPGADLSNSPITKAGSEVNQGLAKQIEKLQTQLKSLDLDAKLAELTKKGNEGFATKGSEGFNFKQSDVDAFVDKYLGGADKAVNLNRNKKKDGQEE